MDNKHQDSLSLYIEDLKIRHAGYLRIHRFSKIFFLLSILSTIYFGANLIISQDDSRANRDNFGFFFLSALIAPGARDLVRRTGEDLCDPEAAAPGEIEEAFARIKAMEDRLGRTKDMEV